MGHTKNNSCPVDIVLTVYTQQNDSRREQAWWVQLYDSRGEQAWWVQLYVYALNVTQGSLRGESEVMISFP